MMVPSVEQRAILEAIKSGKNVKANSMPGSGKTTSILTIAKELPLNILQVKLWGNFLNSRNCYRVIGVIIIDCERKPFMLQFWFNF